MLEQEQCEQNKNILNKIVFFQLSSVKEPIFKSVGHFQLICLSKKIISLVRKNSLLLRSGLVNFITYDIQRKSCLVGEYSILSLFAETALVPAWVNPEVNL